jgi:hypothetical protein
MPISEEVRARGGLDSGEVEAERELGRPERPVNAAAPGALFGVASGFAEEGARRPLPPRVEIASHFATKVWSCRNFSGGLFGPFSTPGSK